MEVTHLAPVLKATPRLEVVATAVDVMASESEDHCSTTTRETPTADERVYDPTTSGQPGSYQVDEEECPCWTQPERARVAPLPHELPGSEAFRSTSLDLPPPASPRPEFITRSSPGGPVDPHPTRGGTQSNDGSTAGGSPSSTQSSLAGRIARLAFERVGFRPFRSRSDSGVLQAKRRQEEHGGTQGGNEDGRGEDAYARPSPLRPQGPPQQSSGGGSTGPSTSLAWANGGLVRAIQSSMDGLRRGLGLPVDGITGDPLERAQPDNSFDTPPPPVLAPPPRASRRQRAKSMVIYSSEKQVPQEALVAPRQGSIVLEGLWMGVRRSSIAGLADSLKNIGGASSKLFNKMLGRPEALDSTHEAKATSQVLWFASLEDFKPIVHILHRGRYMTASFACARATGQHFVLKKYDKRKMLASEEACVRRAMMFGDTLEHPYLVECSGMWEDDEAIYMVEEYAIKGDILHDFYTYPEKYTESFVALKIARPLLECLQYLHHNNIIHRSLWPENLLLGKDDKLCVGHLTSAIDQQVDRPKTRVDFLDYMAPEMLAMRELEEETRNLLEDEEEDNMGAAYASTSRHASSVVLDNLGSRTPSRALRAIASLPPAMRGAQLAHEEGPGASGFLRGWSSEHRITPHEGEGTGPSMTDEDAGTSNTTTGRGPHPINRFLSRRHDPWQPGTAWTPPDLEISAAPWECQDHYNEKVDIWQIGCLLHELLCGELPFEVAEDPIMTAALILWADVVKYPDHLTPECRDFLASCLEKDPMLRPSTLDLLGHHWLLRHQLGEEEYRRQYGPADEETDRQRRGRVLPSAVMGRWACWKYAGCGADHHVDPVRSPAHCDRVSPRP